MQRHFQSSQSLQSTKANHSFHTLLFLLLLVSPPAVVVVAVRVRVFPALPRSRARGLRIRRLAPSLLPFLFLSSLVRVREQDLLILVLLAEAAANGARRPVVSKLVLFRVQLSANATPRRRRLRRVLQPEGLPPALEGHVEGGPRPALLRSLLVVILLPLAGAAAAVVPISCRRGTLSLLPGLRLSVAAGIGGRRGVHEGHLGLARPARGLQALILPLQFPLALPQPLRLRRRRRLGPLKPLSVLPRPRVPTLLVQEL
mmetsp:Transcript_14488/g.36569  ORF Transcript_14488/g.36569 Transcript_14488/m.36569 type:complete len:258 (+) Transcript_14488:647-1420(+)